jgi:hypothetical protein
MGTASGWAGMAAGKFQTTGNSTTNIHERALAEGLKDLAWAVNELDRQNDELKTLLYQLRH